MNPTAIQAATPTAPQPPAPSASPPDVVPSLKKHKGICYKMLEVCASLRVTVVLFLLSFILVFYGTWAQVDAGIWTVVNEYFRWFWVWIPTEIIFLRTFESDLLLLFPGGWTLGFLLLVNLLAAHAIRFKVSWQRSGILLIHSGLVLMMLGEFVTGVFAIEGRMTIAENNSSNFVEDDRKKELAIVDPSNPKVDDEVVIPNSFLSKGGLIRHAELPFDVEIDHYMINSDLRGADRHQGANPATAGLGLQQVAVERSETAGVDSEQRIEIASAYVTFKKKDTGEALGTYLVSTWFTLMNMPAQEVAVDGKKYQVYLRAKRTYRPYTIYLKEFRHDVWPGTKTPRNYQSDVRLIDPERGEDREVKIWMNHPLRYRGETFYQSGLHPLAWGTVLQVVRNPGWLMPYISCVLVTLGMLVHFGMMLTDFLRRRLA